MQAGKAQKNGEETPDWDKYKYLLSISVKDITVTRSYTHEGGLAIIYFYAHTIKE